MLKIKELRHEFGYTQEVLAQKMNLKYYNIGDWERGKCEPCSDDLIKLSKIFNVTVDYLIGNDEYELNTHRGKEKTLSKEENELLNYFRNISPPARESLLVTARNFYELITTSKKVN